MSAMPGGRIAFHATRSAFFPTAIEPIRSCRPRRSRRPKSRCGWRRPARTRPRPAARSRWSPTRDHPRPRRDPSARSSPPAATKARSRSMSLRSEGRPQGGLGRFRLRRCRRHGRRHGFEHGCPHRRPAVHRRIERHQDGIRQRRRDRDMMTDERPDQPIRLGPARHHVFERVIACARAARVWFLVGVELRVAEEPVLEVVDTDLRRLGIVDRAQVARHLQAAPVRLFDHCPHFLARDVRVGLERGHAAIRPVRHRLPRVVGARELADLQVRVVAGPFEIGARDVRCGRNSARLDGLLESQVCVGTGAAAVRAVVTPLAR